MMLKLKLQYFGHLMWRVDSLERLWHLEGLRAGGKGDNRGWDAWMASPAWWTWVWMNSGSLWWTGRPGVLQFMESQRVRLSDWTELNWTLLEGLCYWEQVQNSIWLYQIPLKIRQWLCKLHVQSYMKFTCIEDMLSAYTNNTWNFQLSVHCTLENGDSNYFDNQLWDLPRLIVLKKIPCKIICWYIKYHWFSSYSHSYIKAENHCRSRNIFLMINI